MKLKQNNSRYKYYKDINIKSINKLLYHYKHIDMVYNSIDETIRIFHNPPDKFVDGVLFSYYFSDKSFETFALETGYKNTLEKNLLKVENAKK
jgi:hypothetical protein